MPREAGAREAGAREAGAREAGAREAGAREAGAREAGAREAGARETAAAGEAPARPARPARPGVIDADTLRQRWPDVLEAVKSERRVASILLNDASVDSLESGVLTVAFARGGPGQGFRRQRP